MAHAGNSDEQLTTGSRKRKYDAEGKGGKPGDAPIAILRYFLLSNSSTVSMHRRATLSNFLLSNFQTFYSFELRGKSHTKPYTINIYPRDCAAALG